MVVLCAIAAALPDVDFLLPLRHRGPSHSIGAALLIGIAVLAGLRLWRRNGDSVRVAAAVAVAYATHVLLDWLGADSSPPRGLMALWPMSSAFFVSNLDLFNSVDRRYWLAGFWERNAVALARELLILGPLVAAAAWSTRRRPLPPPGGRRGPPGVRSRFSQAPD